MVNKYATNHETLITNQLKHYIWVNNDEEIRNCRPVTF